MYEHTGVTIMSIFAYPAVLSFDKTGWYIRFPDLPNVFTDGDTRSEAIEMGQDALTLMLMYMEDENIAVPEVSSLSDIPLKDSEQKVLVTADTDAYRIRYGTKLVKKTLAIPQWLNSKAEDAGINFSDVLQKALKQELNIS